MKHYILKRLFQVVLTICAVAPLSGCDSAIYSGEEDCDPVHVIRFVYHRNMKFADAFPKEVPSVDLFVFNESGRLVRTVSRHIGAGEGDSFAIELRDMAPGHYNLLAWCGVKDSEHFLVNPTGESDPAIHHHLCRIARTEDEVIDSLGHITKDIGRLYHGRLDNVDMTADEGHHEHVVELTKDTNVIRVVLQHLSGAEMNQADYDVTITDANGLYDHNNNLLPDKTLTYHPWIQKGGTATFHPEDDPGSSAAARAQTSVSAVVSELTTGRLMADRYKDARLTVRHASSGNTILSIPLIDYLLLVKGHYYTEDGHTPMTDQEYLDRQDEYPMTFFLDDRDEWIRTVIYINSWRVVLNESSIH